MFKEMLAGVREVSPLTHCITNYVTINDCANILLACGASPIMADDVGEVEEITSLSKGLAINIGKLDQRTIPAMLAAGKRANALGHPVLLDPVGAGSSTLRTRTALDLLANIRFTVIRGNISEIKVLASGHGNPRGVDADLADQVTDANLEQAVSFVKDFARKSGAVIAMTGAIDIVTDGDTAYCIRNGDPMMRKVTGTGCQLSAMTAAYLAANPAFPLRAAAAAVCAMGVCGEIAGERLPEGGGSATYRIYLIDAIDHLTPEELERRAKYEVR